MPKRDINAKPFDEGTKTKLEIFQLYVREWLPVFLASQRTVLWPEVDLFDFFCGSGQDTLGVHGSPLRILEELAARPEWLARRDIQTTVHFSDGNDDKIRSLEKLIDEKNLRLPNLRFDVQSGDYRDRLEEAKPILLSNRTACFVFLDQYGIKDVTEEVFQFLTGCPCTDIIFFISSGIFSRLGDHPSTARHLKVGKPEDNHEVHRAVVEHFRNIAPSDYHLASVSDKKKANVYGLVFGSHHPKGAERFLRVAWREDELNGEANFDINREGLVAGQQMLFGERPTKVTAFEIDLEQGIRSRKLDSEEAIYRFCINSAMTPSHADTVISKLKGERIIECRWRVPNISSLREPRPLKYDGCPLLFQ